MIANQNREIALKIEKYFSVISFRNPTVKWKRERTQPYECCERNSFSWVLSTKSNFKCNFKNVGKWKAFIDGQTYKECNMRDLIHSNEDKIEVFFIPSLHESQKMWCFPFKYTVCNSCSCLFVQCTRYKDIQHRFEFIQR